MLELSPLLSVFKDRINDLVSEVNDEISQKLSKSLLVYTSESLDKISEVKTFLYNEQKVKFEDVYFPINIKYSENENIDTENFDNLFKKGNFISIIGTAGSGKTMLLRHLFLNAIKSGYRIPIMIELRKLNSESTSLTEYISQKIFDFDLAKNHIIMKRLFQNGDFIFFLDGYDELSLSTKEKRTKEIEEFVDKFPENAYIITSRPENEILGIQRFNNYRVKELDDYQIDLFIKKQLSHFEDGEALESKILHAVKSANSNISAYFKNPLLLSMFILTFNYHPELPQKRSEFYFNVFDTLFIKHDSITKGGGFKHDIASHLDRPKIELLLEYFSYRTYFKNRYIYSGKILYDEFDEIRKKVNFDFDVNALLYDLETSICLLVKDGIDYTFPHRSMQEYFTAKLIMSQPESNRIKIYNNKKFRYGRNQNLWTLCMELNHYDFMKNFVYPRLNTVIKEIDDAIDEGKNTKEINLLDYVITASHFVITYDDNSSIATHSRNFEKSEIFMLCGMNRGLMAELSILSFLHSKDFVPYMSIMEHPQTHKEVKGIDLFKEKEKFIPLLVDLGFNKKLMKKYKEMKDLVSKIKDELETEKEDNDSLIDI